MRCGGCGGPVKFVIIEGHRTIAVEPEPHPHGTIACPTDRHKNLAYVLERDEPPSVGYRRHRRHTHHTGDAA